jgi:hypothetical protein
MAPTTSSTRTTSLDDLAWAIAADGISAHLAAARGAAVCAQRAGLAPIAAAVVLDDGAPTIARERAFGLVAVALAAAAIAADAAPVPTTSPVPATVPAKDPRHALAVAA